MSDDSFLEGAPGERLAGLFELSEMPEWSERDVGSIYRHFLHSKVELNLVPPRSLHELLTDPATPAFKLREIKAFAQAWQEREDGCLPVEVAAVVYWLAIAAGLAHASRALSSLPDGEVAEGLRWAASRPWPDAAEREVLRRAIARGPEGEEVPAWPGATSDPGVRDA